MPHAVCARRRVGYSAVLRICDRHGACTTTHNNSVVHVQHSDNVDKDRLALAIDIHAALDDGMPTRRILLATGDVILGDLIGAQQYAMALIADECGNTTDAIVGEVAQKLLVDAIRNNRFECCAKPPQ